MKCLGRIVEWELYQFKMPVILSNMYILIRNGMAVVVDPHVSLKAEKLLRENSISECLVLATHEHFDHISGVNWLGELYPCEVVVSKKCAENMKNTLRNGARTFGALFLNNSEQERKQIGELWNPNYTCATTKQYDEKYEFEWHNLKIELIEAPGHSDGGQLILLNKDYVFTGDNLIPEEKTITRLLGGSKRKYEEVTMPILKALRKEVIVFPGHGETTLLKYINL